MFPLLFLSVTDAIFRFVIDIPTSGEIHFVEQAFGTGPELNSLYGSQSVIDSALGVRRDSPFIGEGTTVAPRLLSTQTLLMACGLLVEPPVHAGGPTVG